MGWQNNPYERYSRREIPAVRFFRYALMGLLLGMVLVFVEESLFFDDVYAYYELSKILCWLSSGDDLEAWRSFWPPLADYGKVSPRKIVAFIEHRNGLQLWFFLRLLLCHGVSFCGVFWYGYRWSTRAMLHRALDMGGRGTRIVSAREANKLFRRKLSRNGDNHD